MPYLLRFNCLLTLFVLVGVQNATLMSDRGVAQSVPPLVCAPDQSVESRILTPSEQARAALDSRDSKVTFEKLQEALSIALQVEPTLIHPDLVSQWLLNDGSSSTPRFERLIKLAGNSQSTQLRSTLDQLFQITQRLFPTHSLIKTRALAAIARHYTTLGQPQTATSALNQAREAAPFIQGATFKAKGLLDVAEGSVMLSQPQAAQSILEQVEKTIQQIPAAQSTRLELLQQLAAIYAQSGNYAKAKDVAATLPKNSESQAITLREIANAYSNAQQLNNAEQLIATITNPAQKTMALGQLAVGYDKAKQPDKATQRFRQALQVAKSLTAKGETSLRELVIRKLVTDYLTVGRRDEAKQLAQTDLTFFQPEAFKAIMAADIQAKRPDRATQLLSQQLSQIQNKKDDWQRAELADLIRTATEAQLFDWILQEWARISTIDYGLQDEQIQKIVEAYAQSGQHTQALNWVEQLPIANRSLLRVKLRATIALIAHQSGQTAWAKTLLQQTQQQIEPLAKAASERIKREGGDISQPIDLKYIGVGAIALTYAQMGETETSRQLLEQVVQLNASAGDTGIGGRIDNPFTLFLNAKQAIGALQLAQGTQNPDGREYRLQSAATLLLNQNRFDLAIPIVDQLTPERRKTQLLLAIAQRYVELRQSDQALPMLDQAFKVAQTIPGDESQVDRLGAEGGTIIDMTDDRGSLLEAIAVEYARLKQPVQAQKVANTLQDKNNREQALQLIQCAARA
ncbi:tetratricopeptide repeat protein [Phormidesmis sp. 146-33]